MSFKIIDPNFFPPVVSKKKNHKIIVISDTHVGGITGYLPSGCVDERGNTQHQTIHQEKMETNLLAELKKVGKIDELIFLGDMVDGKNVKAGGLDISNVNTDCQVQWAYLMAKSFIEILKPKIIMGLNGSDYHVEDSLDRRLLRRLSIAYPKSEVYFGTPSLKFFLGDKLWFLSHTFTEGASKAGSLERNWNKMHSMQWERGRTPDVMGYAHIHKAQNPYQLKNGKRPVYCFIAPCQKTPDSFCSKGPIGASWEIGFMYLEQQGVKLRGEYENTYPYWENKEVNQPSEEIEHV
jgi:hypothetical protein